MNLLELHNSNIDKYEAGAYRDHIDYLIGKLEKVIEYMENILDKDFEGEAFIATQRLAKIQAEALLTAYEEVE